MVLDHLLRAKELPLAALILVQLLCPVLTHRRVRQDRHEDRLQGIYTARRMTYTVVAA